MKIETRPSPNFDDRTLPMRFLILHYTGMESGAAAISRLCDPDAKVSAHYVVEEDGSVYLFTGAADTGQGSDTALSQIAAQALGVSFARIKCKAADTEITPFDTDRSSPKKPWTSFLRSRTRDGGLRE